MAPGTVRGPVGTGPVQLDDQSGGGGRGFHDVCALINWFQISHTIAMYSTLQANDNIL